MFSANKNAPAGAFFSSGLIRLFVSLISSLGLHIVILAVALRAYRIENLTDFPSGSFVLGKHPIIQARFHSDLPLHSSLTSGLTNNQPVTMRMEKSMENPPLPPPPTDSSDAEHDRTALLPKPPANQQPHYYTRSEVDRSSRMAGNVLAKGGLLEQALQEYDDQGSVTFELWINEAGSIDQSMSTQTGLSDEVYGIIKAVIAQTTYLPARLNNQAVKSKMEIEIEVRRRTQPLRIDAR